MLLVLDSNEFIFALGNPRKQSCELLLDKILDTFPKNTIRIARIIIEEVKRNVSPGAFKEFMSLVNTITHIDEDISVPFELGAQYEALGLKSSDALIGAFVEWSGAEVLVSENRHFLNRRTLPFRIINAETCLKLLG